MNAPRRDLDDLHRYGASLRALAHSLLADPSRADDVVQDAYVAALERGARALALPDDPGAWLARVVRNRSFKVMRSETNSRAREHSAYRDTATRSGDEVLERIELQQAVLAAVRELREPFRICIWMRFFEERTPVEIGRSLDVPLKTVKSRLSRGRSALRRSLAREFDAEGRDGLSLLGVWLGQTVDPCEVAAGGKAGVALSWKGAVLAAGAAVLVLTGWRIESALEASARSEPMHAPLGTGRTFDGPATETAHVAMLSVPEFGGRTAIMQDEPGDRGTPVAGGTTLEKEEGSEVCEELIPSGSINAAQGGPDPLFIVDDHARLLAEAKAVRDSFFPGAVVLTGAEALTADLSGHTLIVYATPDNPWLAREVDRLPFKLDDKGVTLHRAFEGEHLRIICTIKSPADPERRAVLYVAADPDDLLDINAVFHGPTEWVVADGARTLDEGHWVLTKPLSPERSQVDLEMLVESLLAVHPATHAGMPAETADAVERARKEVERELSREQLWFVLNGVLLSLHDSHSSLSTAVSGDSLELPLRWLDGGLYVDGTTDALQFGERVISIAGRTEEQILGALLGLIPAENEPWIRHCAPRFLRDVEVLRRLGFTLNAPVEVVVEREGVPVAVSVSLGATPSSSLPEERPWVSWRIDEENDLGLFVLDQCTPDDHYLSELGAFFRAVSSSGLTRIAIDLRENSGGDSRVANEFLRYLAVDTYADFSAEVRVSGASLAQRGDYGLGPGLHSWTNERVQNSGHEEPPSFAGEVFVLTSPRTFSSGSWFAVVLRDNDLATIVGEATGGSPSSYGDVLSFTLPESGFSYTLSHKRFRRPDPTRDPTPFLKPDIFIPLEAWHLVERVDPVLDYLTGR